MPLLLQLRNVIKNCRALQNIPTSSDGGRYSYGSSDCVATGCEQASGNVSPERHSIERIVAG